MRNQKYMIDLNSEDFDIIEIFNIKPGFNVMTFNYKDKKSKLKEQALPFYYFDNYTFDTIEDCMVFITKTYNLNDIRDFNKKQRVFEYKQYLLKYYPERLV